MKPPKKKLIELFTLFGYEYDREEPSGRIIFYDFNLESNCQFYMYQKEPIFRAVALIKERIERSAQIRERIKIQAEFRKLMGLND